MLFFDVELNAAIAVTNEMSIEYMIDIGHVK